MNWKDIKLKTAVELMQIDESNLDELEMVIKQISIIKDMDEADIEKWTPDILIKEIKEYEFIKNLPKAKLNKTFKYNNIEYQMCEMNKLTLAQMVDIEEYYKLGLKDNIEKIMSVLFLPVKSKNKITGKVVLEEYEPDLDRENAILEQDMEFVWSNLLFFCNIETKFMSHLEASLKEKEMMKEMKS